MGLVCCVIGMYTVAEYILGIVIGVCMGFGVRWGVYAVGMYILRMWLGECMVEIDVYPLHTPWIPVYIYTQSIPRTPQHHTQTHIQHPTPNTYSCNTLSDTFLHRYAYVCVVGECVCVCIRI